MQSNKKLPDNWELLDLLKQYFKLISGSNAPANASSEMKELHSRILIKLKALKEGNFKTMISTLLDFVEYKQAQNKTERGRIEKKAIKNFNDFVSVLEKKIPADLWAYPDYILYILFHGANFCVSQYQENFDRTTKKWTSPPDKNFLFMLKQTFNSTRNFITKAKIADDKTEYSFWLLLSTFYYILPFQTPEVKVTINSVTYRIFLEPGPLGDIKQNILNSAHSRSRKQMDQQCLTYLMELQILANSIKKDFHEINTLSQTTLKSLKAFDLDELLKFLNLHQNIPSDSSIINIYERLITSTEHLIYSAPNSFKPELDPDLHANLKVFKTALYNCECVRNYYLGKGIERDTEKEIIKEQVSSVKTNVIEMLAPHLDKFLANVNEEYLNYLQTKEPEEKENARQKALRTHEILEGVIKSIPEYDTTRVLFSALSSYMATKLNPLDKNLELTHQDSLIIFINLFNSNQFPHTELQHAQHILNTLIISKEILIAEYQKNPSDNILQKLAQVRKAFGKYCELITKDKPEHHSACMIHAELFFVPEFVRKNPSDPLSSFLNITEFNKLMKTAETTFTKTDNKHAQCLLHWFRISYCENNILKHKSLDAFKRFTSHKLIEFISTLDFNSLVQSGDADMNSPRILSGVNIYVELANLSLKLINNLEKHFPETVKPASTCHEYKEAYDIFKTKLLFLDFKKQFYAQNFIKSLFKITEDEYEKRNNEISEKLEIAKKIFLEIEKQLSEELQINKQKNRLFHNKNKYANKNSIAHLLQPEINSTIEDEKITEKITQPAASDNNQHSRCIPIPVDDLNYPEIKLPDYALRIFQKLKDAGYEAYLVGGGVRDPLNGKDPNDYDIATNATMPQIIKLFSCETNCEYIDAKHPLFKIKPTAGIKEIQISTFKNGNFLQDFYGRMITANAVYYDPIEKCYLDPGKGLIDIKNKNIRTVFMKIAATIKKHPLLVFAVIRLMARSGYTCNTEMKLELRENIHLLRNQNPNLLHSEVTKTLLNTNHEAVLDYFDNFHILHYVYRYNKFSSHAMLNTISESLANEAIKNNPLLFWASVIEPVIYSSMHNFLQINADVNQFECMYWEMASQAIQHFGYYDKNQDLSRVILLKLLKQYYHYDFWDSQFMNRTFFTDNDHRLANILFAHDFKKNASLSQTGMFAQRNIPARNNQEVIQYRSNKIPQG